MGTYEDNRLELWCPREAETMKRYREAIEIALSALEGYLQGESGLPFTDPYQAIRTAAEALRGALSSKDA